jgi:hypothetical protein
MGHSGLITAQLAVPAPCKEDYIAFLPAPAPSTELLRQGETPCTWRTAILPRPRDRLSRGRKAFRIRRASHHHCRDGCPLLAIAGRMDTQCWFGSRRCPNHRRGCIHRLSQRPRVQHGSLVEKAKMAQSASTELLVGGMLQETVEVAHDD